MTALAVWCAPGMAHACIGWLRTDAHIHTVASPAQAKGFEEIGQEGDSTGVLSGGSMVLACRCGGGLGLGEARASHGYGQGGASPVPVLTLPEGGR